jgi:hypothetical protein
MNSFPRSKKEEANGFLDQLYDGVEGDSRLLIVTGLPARDSSGEITPHMRDLRDVLLSEGLVWESSSGAIGITDKGVNRVESDRALKFLKTQLEVPFPTTLKAIREELESWIRSQHNREHGSIHWNQVESRISHLRYLDQRGVEEELMAKRTYRDTARSLAPEKAIKTLEDQIATAETMRTEPFGSAKREEWRVTSESVLHAAFSPGDLPPKNSTSGSWSSLVM